MRSEPYRNRIASVSSSAGVDSHRAREGVGVGRRRITRTASLTSSPEHAISEGLLAKYKVTNIFDIQIH
jgi:hypothetical protein